MSRSIALCLLLLGGCAGTPQPSGSQALVRADAAGSARCGPDGDPICEARVIRVDGRRVFAGDALAIEPGSRRLTVYCRFNLSIMIGDAQSVEQMLVATLEPARRYRLEARMSPRPCSVALIDHATGRVVAASD